MKSIMTFIALFLFSSSSFAANISEREVKTFFDNWLVAQNTGSYSSYEAMYAGKFTGIKRAGGRTSSFNRNAWLQDRKRMFKNKMSVLAGNVRINTLGTSATVQFEQTWESNGYKDKGDKQLYLVLEKNQLKIAREEMFASSVLTGSRVSFSSVHTNLQKDCKDKFDDTEGDHDIPVICKGPGGYIIDVEFSACCEHMQVQGGKDFLLLFPEQRFVTVMKRKLEWRLANVKPFAVIFKIDKYERDITMTPNKVSGGVLLVKGLEGYENINYQFDIKRYQNPYNEARKLADEGYISKK